MPPGKITMLEVQKHNKQRVNVFLDGEFAFSLSLIEAARLHKGQALSEADIAALRDEDTVLRAAERAVQFLSYRPRSIAEVHQHLSGKDFTPAVVEAATSRLMAQGYIDDLAFARFWVQNRSEFKPRSPLALRQELRQKGVADAIIQEVLAEVDVDGLAYEVASQRARRLSHPTHADFRKKLGSLLQRRGFSFTTVQDTLNRLADELTESDPNYFEDIDNE